ncbi:MAG: amino acid permease [Gammaproteobacteria bacterium]|nr:amino acid permease [Gammaproteobacteria bacterium]
MSSRVHLKRSLSLTQMVLYGLGTTIGAGIYALVGELAGIAGYFAPISFLIAAFMATLTAMSFAELSGRFPQAAGAALYVKEGFGSQNLSTLTGLLVILAGLVSAAALINGFVGYLHQFITLDRIPIIILTTFTLGAIAAWGISTSVSIASFITLIEIGGLLLIVAVSLMGTPFHADTMISTLIPSADFAQWSVIFAGTLLAFYAFIGFEDMVDVAEEIKDVKRNLPLAIILTLVITTILYMLIMVTAVLAVPPEQLAKSKAPLTFLYQHFTGNDASLISIIGLLAIINGALIQIIMASRVMYGLGSRGQLPALLSIVNTQTKTPLTATFIATITVLVLALLGHLSLLAEITSLIMLCIFAMINLALVKVKKQSPNTADSINFPPWIPMLGFIVSLSFLAFTFLNVTVF